MLYSLSIGNIVIIIVSIIISMGIHEAAHAFVSHWLGDTTAKDIGRLTLNPLKHIDLFTTILLPLGLILLHLPPFFIAKPVPFNPYRVKYGEYGVALIGIAGPITNLILAALAALVFRLGHFSLDSQVFNIIYLFTYINIVFFIINMIPIPPLDGSRLLYAFAPDFLKDLMRQIESAGLFAIIFIMLIIVNVGGNGIFNLENNILNFLFG